MGRQLIAMGVGMGIVPGGKGRFYQRAVGRVGIRVIHRVVVFLIVVAFLVLPGM